MSIETPAQSIEDTAAAAGPSDAPALRPRARRRTLGSRLTEGPVQVAAAVLFLAILTVGVGLSALFIYQGQAGTVTALEALASARSSQAGANAPYGSTTASPLPEAKVKEFEADPVFKGPEWEAQLAASRDVRRAVHEADVAFAARAGSDVWVPWLTGRVRDAGASLSRFDPNAGDAAEVAAATASAARVCQASDVDAFVGGQVKAAGSAYEAAVSKAFPGLAKAARAHFCPAGSQIQTTLPFDKEQQRR